VPVTLTRFSITALVGAMVLGTVDPASAQCDGRWLPGHASSSISPGGINTVSALVSFDPDGSGPESSMLVAAGPFSSVGRMPAQGVVGCDGGRWFDLGSVGAQHVNRILVHQERLIASTASPAKVIRRHNGSWLTLGVFSGVIHDMVECRGEVFVSGEFTRVGDVSVTSCARWDGAAWHAVGIGPGAPGERVQIRTTVAVDDHLMAFALLGEYPTQRSAMLSWDGAQWTELVSETGVQVTWVTAMAQHEGELFASGSFDLGNGGGVVQRFARWSPQGWQIAGSATPNTGSGDLHVHDGVLYANSLNGGRLLRWRGEEWDPIEIVSQNMGLISAIGSWNGELVIAAPFSFAWYLPATRIVRVTPSGPRIIPEGASSVVRATLSHEGELFVLGEFGAIGGVVANRAAAWDGAHWRTLGEYYASSPRVMLRAVDGEAYAAFDQGALHWDGGQWVDNWFVTRNLVRHQNMWYSVHAANLHWWNGTTWIAIGGAFAESWRTPVAEVCEFQGHLYAAGEFQGIGGVTARNIAKWDGAQWQPVGAGTNGEITDLAAFNGELIACGLFTQAGGASANHIAAWNGVSWRPLHSGCDGFVNRLFVYRDNLIAAGNFTSAGGNPMGRIARWNGTNWSPLGLGLDGTTDDYYGVYSLSEFRGELIVGSSFLSAGGQPSAFLARWTDTNSPWIAHHPADAAASLRGTANFTVTPAPGYDPLTFRWQMHDPPVPGEWRDLADGPLVIAGQEVASLSGASGATLTITPSVNFGGMTLRAVISNECGEAASDPAILTITNCDPDLNCDGSADQGDLACLVLALAGDPSCFCQSDPDFNLDGSADQGDVAALIGVVAGGECP